MNAGDTIPYVICDVSTKSLLILLAFSNSSKKREKSENYCKADHNIVYCFFITIFRLAMPAFFKFTDVKPSPFFRLASNAFSDIGSVGRFEKKKLK